MRESCITYTINDWPKYTVLDFNFDMARCNHVSAFPVKGERLQASFHLSVHSAVDIYNMITTDRFRAKISVVILIELERAF